MLGADEPRYARIAHGVLDSGDPLVLRLDGEVYREKPPLWYWSAALAGAVTGDLDDLTVRLPSALSTVALLVVLAVLSSRLLGDRKVGILAGALYVLTYEGLTQATRARLDTTLTLLTTAAAAVFLLGLREGRSGYRAYVVGWILVGLGFLTKGPPAILPPLLAVAAFAVVRRDARAALRIAPARGLLTALAVLAAWFVPWSLRIGSGGVAEIWSRQVADRVVGEPAHAEPIWFYLEQLPERLLPWTILVPGFVVAWARGLWRPDRDRRMLALWFAGGVVVFSLFAGKRTLYLLPFYPAACLLLADHLAQVASLGRTGRVAATLTAVVPVLLGGFLVAAVGTPAAIAVGVTAALVTALGLVALRAGRPVLTVGVAVAGTLLLAIPAAILAGPVLDAREGVVAISRKAGEILRPDDTLVRLGTGNHAVDWYTHRTWVRADTPAEIPRPENGRVVVLVKGRHADEVPGLRILEETGEGRDRWVLGTVGRPPPPGPGH
jgi:4-amino-4-deoxy-L-arabinose transferase-like glycosyltransferase